MLIFKFFATLTDGLTQQETYVEKHESMCSITLMCCLLEPLELMQHVTGLLTGAGRRDLYMR